MRIDTELNVGDIMYVVEKEFVSFNDCGFCKGDGKFKITGKNGEEAMVVCPKCLGRKIAITKKAVVKGREIDSIDVCVSDEGGIEVTYRDECEDAYTLDPDGKPGFTDEVAFKTFEEAQAYADKLNGEEKR